MSRNTLFQLNPADKLSFTLSLFNPAQAVLLIKNITDGPIAFKVKTTQPSWYTVSPNKDAIPAGGTFKVQISLLDNMKNSLVELFMNGNKENLDRHRFQVQGKVINDSVYTELKEMEDRRWDKKDGTEDEEFKQATADRSARFTEVWGGVAKDDPNKAELKVDFSYDISDVGSSPARVDKAYKDMEFLKEKYASAGSGSHAAHEPGAAIPSVSNNVENVRNRLARERGGSDGGPKEGLPANQEAAMRELLSLRKKFEAVSDYTMQLTAERDSMKAKFEALQREISREDSRRGADGTNSGNDASGGSEDKLGAADTQVAQKAQGWFLPGIFTLAAVVVVAYLLGRSMAAAHFFHGLFGYGITW
jgi:hypothetical protein